MKKALKIGGISLVTLIIVLVGVSYLLPRYVTVERSVVIDAKPAEVFPYVNSFEKFNEWSPWAGIDPDTKYTFEGPDRGQGAKMTWTSDHPDVGSGSQEIIDSRKNQYVRTELDFGEQGTGEAWYRLENVEAGTEVTWGLKADMGNNPIGRWIGLAMDGMIGPDYERGLADLKELVESE